ncbi:peptidoglycan D,D-transpeptidase FtsI family protein [Chitinilyticum piscinae]|uniref:Peptidoglycan D,D-transpeptidase FtsI n=1 Tax=Chitinilyticum piscinae TaxID=2866724 RepID=A0A8J7FYJ1_9NEIS|nr:penicillin-binding protein 2 [Chitinilyticum piscinae]MBE9608048.1 penicillin-binding protein 2 [Chitinilyticum piscinae]
MSFPNTASQSRRNAGRRPQKPQPRLEHWRAWFVLGCLLLMFAALLGRGAYLQGYNEEFLKDQGDARYTRTLKLEALRGMIIDRNGELLAQSTTVQSIWASPRSITLLPAGEERAKDWRQKNESDTVPVSAGEVRKLASLLGVSEAELHKKLFEERRNSAGETQKKPDFVWLKRQMSPAEGKAVMALNIPGIYAQTEYRRFYPAGEQLAHVIGFTDIDGRGQEGFELTRDKTLAGKAGSRTVIRDRRGYIVEDISTIVPPLDGQTLQLSIDRRIQYLAFRELKSMVEQSHAVGGAIVVLDARTGEVLAMANAPSYNPNSRAKIDPAQRRNRAVTDLYEPGSTMKAITAAMALDAGKVKPTSTLNTEGGRMTIGPATIKDDHPGGVMTIEQIIQKSSNVGAAKMALMMEREDHYNFLKSLDFGEKLNSGFPGEAAGRVRPWKDWRPIEQATMAYGYGASVSVLQMAHAYQIFANDGQLRPITFTKQVAPIPGRQIIKAETAQAVRKMLEMVTLPGGTATRAQVVGYRVGGKTGTAKKLVNGVYSDTARIGSFVGIAPISDPRIVVAVMIDEPTFEMRYGGLSAAPVFSNVVAGTLRILGVPPDSPTENILLSPPGAPELLEET